MNPAHVEAIRILTHQPEQPGIDWAQVRKTKHALLVHVLMRTPMSTDDGESLVALLDWMQDLAVEAKVWPNHPPPCNP